MADIDLPVFSFRHNFEEPISERLSFLTDILRSVEGVEQRRSLRQTPRRTFEGDFLLVGPERTFWANFMDQLGSKEVMIPLYWEVVALPSALTGLNLSRINFDTTNREWPYFAGGLAMLMGESALDYEVVRIQTVDATGISLAAPALRTWKRGTKMYPLRRGTIESVSDLSHKAAAVGKTSAQFKFSASNPWTPAMGADPIYLDRPVLTSEPNWVEDLTLDIQRTLATFDTKIGRTYQKDVAGRTFAGQSHRWFLPGRERLAKFRDLLYRNRGRTGSFWLPTFKADFKLVTSVTAGSSQLVVENTGLLYTGGVKPGREHIAIRHAGGTIFRKITSVTAGTTNETERLGLDSPVGLALSPGQVRKISYMDTARFDVDDFEIVHHSGIDGLHECSAVFRAFKATRTAPLPISYPIPISPKNTRPCGDPLSGLDHYQFMAVNSPYDGQLGAHPLGFVMAWRGIGLEIPLTKFVCNDPLTGRRYGIFDSPDGEFEEQEVGVTIQGQGTEQCDFSGNRVSFYQLYVIGPTWPEYRLCPPIRTSDPNVDGGGVKGTGIVQSLFGAFPERMDFKFFPHYDDPRYVG